MSVYLEKVNMHPLLGLYSQLHASRTLSAVHEDAVEVVALASASLRAQTDEESVAV